MTPTALRVLWILAGAAFFVLLGASWKSLVDSAIEDRYGRDLRRAQGLHAELDEYVMKCRTGLATSYDPLEQTFTELKRLHKQAEAIPRLLGPDGRAEVSARSKEYGEALVAKKALIEDFKRENSVLRNSLRFFPPAARELADRLDARPGGKELSTRLNALLGEVLLYNLLSDKEFRPRVDRAIEAMASAPTDTAAPADREELQRLITHARTIVERRPRVDVLMDRILGMPVAAHAREVDAAYSRGYGAAIDMAATRRLLLSLLAMAVLGLAAADIITRLRRSQLEARAATAEAERANEALRVEKEKEHELAEMKSRFISMTSHEFGGPLTKILQSSEMLEAYGAKWPQEKRDLHFSRIKDHVLEMKRQLHSVFLIRSAEADRLEYSPAPCDVKAICTELVETVGQGAGAVRIEPRIEGDWEGARLDRRLLDSVLSNLLSNAIKYSGDGKVVEFAARREGDEAVFVVRDEGIGIPLEDQPRLFDMFQRASNVGTITGSGLGLAIVKKCVDRCQGEVTFRSRPGEGTRFQVRIPC